MNMALTQTARKPIHAWLHPVTVTHVPGPSTPLLDRLLAGLLEAFQAHGHEVQAEPDDHTDLILATARYGEPVSWRDAPLFTARRRYHLDHTPGVYTLIHLSRAEFQQILSYLEQVLAKEPADPSDFAFAGLSPRAFHVLLEQGRRGGPILALERLLQAQTKSIRILLAIGDQEAEAVYTLDLVGAHPRTDNGDPEAFFEELILRIVTNLSTHEVAEHMVVGSPIPRTLWQSLSTPKAMIQAGQRLGERNFFTEMVRIADLVQVPTLADAISSQYSEGCFSTWDATLHALIATVTGSARPVDKDKITEEDLAVIVGIRSDGRGALVREIEGHANHSPSSEAVEMMAVDQVLPQISLASWGIPDPVPVVRSKLHGHRAIVAFDPAIVEYVPLDPPYYYYPVSCATEAQAVAIQRAFARAEALRNPSDPRQIAFTVLPGHGAVIMEKWVVGTLPFQVIYEQMDRGRLVVGNEIPQGSMRFVQGADGLMFLRPE